MLLTPEAIHDFLDLNKRREDELAFAAINEETLRRGATPEELIEMVFHVWKFRASVLSLEPWTPEAVYMPAEDQHVKLHAMNPGFERGNQWMDIHYLPAMQWPDAHPHSESVQATYISLARDTRTQSGEYRFKGSLKFPQPETRSFRSVQVPDFASDTEVCGDVYRSIWKTHTTAPLMYDRGLRIPFDRKILFSTKSPI